MDISHYFVWNRLRYFLPVSYRIRHAVAFHLDIVIFTENLPVAFSHLVSWLSQISLLLQEISGNCVHLSCIGLKLSSVINSSYESFSEKQLRVIALGVQGVNVFWSIVIYIPVLCKNLPELISVPVCLLLRISIQTQVFLFDKLHFFLVDEQVVFDFRLLRLFNFYLWTSMVPVVSVMPALMPPMIIILSATWSSAFISIFAPLFWLVQDSPRCLDSLVSLTLNFFRLFFLL